MVHDAFIGSTSIGKEVLRARLFGSNVDCPCKSAPWAVGHAVFARNLQAKTVLKKNDFTARNIFQQAPPKVKSLS
jgi:hypothetical protein